MALEMKVPSPGESITEVEIAQWLVEDGDWVEKDQAIAEVDSDKATLELPAEESGIITLKAEAGDTVAVGDVVCLIDTSAEKPAGFESPKAEAAPTQSAAPVQKKSEPAPNPMPASSKENYASGHPSVAAKKIMDENGVSANQVNGTGKDGRVT
ncbi:MAG: dihydrolipoyllysine-residue succinyltransferase, partial [Flavobacteriaceae bacterium]|nr:dihydrolipoyllysine-residue succinyltransferase [Flavobacteriaceae bacterium]